MTLDDLGQFRNEVLWWEICSILHDVGKLSDEFLWYRQHWHRMKQGYWNRDPHDHGWLRTDAEKAALVPPEKNLGDSILNSEFAALRKFFGERLTESKLSGAVLSVERAVHCHIDPPKDDVALQLLKRGDGLDSRYDRNSPLAGCEQTNFADASALPEIYRSDVFGYEPNTPIRRGIFECRDFDNDLPTRKSEGELAAGRRELYRKLDADLRQFYPGSAERILLRNKYFDVRRTIRRSFRRGLSDTTRPGNDTDLWEHTFSVASVTKALHLEALIRGISAAQVQEIDAGFQVWGIGFDALRYLSHAHKIGDVLGRREVLLQIFRRMRDLIEYEIPFGNEVYRDDGFQIFMVPGLSNQSLLEELEERATKVCLETSGGELVPQFARTERVSSLTRIVEVIDRLRGAVATPVTHSARVVVETIEAHWRVEGAANADVCSVCRIRPALKDESRKVCLTCAERRRDWTRGFSAEEPGGTPMLAEIVDGNGRAAMIVAKFGLDEWLNGRMVRTLLITQSDSIERTGEWLNFVQEANFHAGAEERKTWYRDTWGPSRDYEGILHHFNEARAGNQKKPLFLFTYAFPGGVSFNEDEMRARKAWEADLQSARVENATPATGSEEEMELAVACAKTPTPSTVLDVWETTKRFLERIQKHPEDLGFSATGRDYFTVDPLPQVSDRESLSATGEGGTAEVVFDGGRLWIVRERERGTAVRFSPGDKLVLKRDDGEEHVCNVRHAGTKEQAFYPFRVITASPDILLMIVPADRVVDITSLLYKAYLREFGKVYGRLPFSIGHIVFQQHLPMFSVLDAARRMEANFRILNNEGPISCELPMDPQVDLEPGTLKLVTGEDDWFHPYVLLNGDDAKAPGYFKTVAGPVGLMAQAGKTAVRFRPNYYDCEFLGASAHRFRLYLDSRRRDKKRQGPVWIEHLLGSSRVFGIEHIWAALNRSRLANSSLRNFEQMIVGRQIGWRKEPESERMEQIRALAATWARACGFGADVEQKLLEGVDDGLFFRTLELYLRILKLSMKEDQYATQHA